MKLVCCEKGNVVVVGLRGRAVQALSLNVGADINVFLFHLLKSGIKSTLLHEKKEKI